MTLAVTRTNIAFHSEHLPNEEGESSQICASEINDWFSERNANVDTINQVADFLSDKKSVFSHFYKGKPYNDDNFTSNQACASLNTLFDTPESAIAHLDASLWERLMKRSDLTDAMSSQRKDEWDNHIKNLETPEFTPENVIPTINNLVHSQSQYFAERVDTVFHALSPDHVTNSPAAFGKRIIIKKVTDNIGSVSSTKSVVIDDLRVIVAVTLKRAPVSLSTMCTNDILTKMISHQEYGQWYDLDGGALRIKIFQVGTVHIELHPDVSYKMNDILAMLYPHAIPTSFRRAPKKPAKAFPEPIKRTVSPDALIILNTLKQYDCRRNRDLMDTFGVRDVVYSLSSKIDVQSPAFEEVKSIIASIGGEVLCTKTNTWLCDYDLTKAIRVILRTGVLPDKKSHQYYPSKGDIGTIAKEKLINAIEWNKETTLLEPSAGQAHLLTDLPECDITAVELSELNAAILREKGFKRVVCDDFLKFAKSYDKQFDAIIMNPPYSSQQALAHVMTAYQLLTEQGALVAIVPVNVAELIKEDTLKLNPTANVDISESYSNAFDDANVTVCIVTINK